MFICLRAARRTLSGTLRLTASPLMSRSASRNSSVSDTVVGVRGFFTRAETTP
jgi:hypothetical protein